MPKADPLFIAGARATLPLTFGVIPFGLVMGAVSANAQLSLFDAMAMNFLVYAGASQLAAIDLMTQHAASTVVVLTGLVINLRFLLYSAALSPVLQRSPFLTQLFCAYSMTDQTYAIMSANESRFPSKAEAVRFYLGTSVCFLVVWNSSVAAGHVFGNFAPASWSLDFAVPLSFLALVIPTLRSRLHLLVAAFSTLVSLPLHALPYRAGLIVSALLAIGLARALIQWRKGAPT
jgi:predicted branched-subunit amino acid permease